MPAPTVRDRLARVFERGLDEPVGFVLPLQRWNTRDGQRWITDRWHTRSGKLLLTPGDSALGYRLPLNSLPPPSLLLSPLSIFSELYP